MRDDIGAPRQAADGSAALLWRLAWVLWLPVLAYPVTGFYRSYPISQLLHEPITPLHRATALAAVVLFNAIYAWTMWRHSLDRIVPPMRPARMAAVWAPLVLLTAVPVALVLFDRQDWLTLFILTGASMGASLPTRQAASMIAALVLLTAGVGWLAGAGWPTIGPTLFLVGFVGVVVISLVNVVVTNRELRAARAEIARLAVSEERLRFARDLHDLLGQNLSHIALKSEVAEVLVPSAPDRAVAAIHEVADVARTALAEMRAAVAGYRQPTLAGELAGAAEILASAGIAHSRDGDAGAMPPATEAVLAWAVREGVTNVVRHARTTHCTIRVGQAEGYAHVEIDNDGPGAAAEAIPSAGSPSGGNGLRGLGERVTAAGGRYCAAHLPGGGFRLSVSVPLRPR